ncbi:MAG: 30S ribosomal protein S6 [Actinobacteria bacterium]|nr:30S ribosomal protein S6 [Actinomycetota bacterium]MCG2819603.1 30S ribosomal protein S6 [Actinomycetes bacterium]MBU4179674.1 30S ribosomal protein S6 [Actinomycetota bacterium]MBU4218096.1 30S ribosomal protein S6 [Actinomycetota bacterium]MBU4357952.1 30S ribosomal protein S6 [Actinomycetota bacterium]
MRKYETLLIARSELDEDQLKALLDDVTGLIVSEGGTVSGVDVWGLRRLEYPIDHEESGHYAVVSFLSDKDIVRELERVLGIKDEILRLKTLVMKKE